MTRRVNLSFQETEGFRDLELAGVAIEGTNPCRCIVLLHDYGANEKQFAAIVPDISEDALVLIPRGPIAAGPSLFGWFHPCGPGYRNPSVERAEVASSALLLSEMIKRMQLQYCIGRENTAIGGVGQGGYLSAQFTLDHPELAVRFMGGIT